jgi:hypothetical protein
MLFTSPILIFMSLYVAIVYGYLYLIMTTITTEFENVYGISEANIGLTFLGMGKTFLSVSFQFSNDLRRRIHPRRPLVPNDAGLLGD